MDLYGILGLKNSPPPSPEVVRKAYRKMAKSAHPDASTGSPKAWSEVSTALAVLSDPKRKKVYDETGRFEEPPADNEAAQALQTALQNIEGVLDHAVMLRQNPVDLAITSLRTWISQNQREMDAAEKRASGFADMGKRFKTKRGKINRVGPMLLSKAAGLRQGIEQAKGRKKIAEMAIAILQDHSFDWGG